MSDKPEDKTTISFEARVAEAIKETIMICNDPSMREGFTLAYVEETAQKITALFDEKSTEERVKNLRCQLLIDDFHRLIDNYQHEVNTGLATRESEG